MFSETSQTEWREPVHFPTGISGFSMEMRNNKLEIRIGGSSCPRNKMLRAKSSKVINENEMTSWGKSLYRPGLMHVIT